jgi:hypothetical protein
MSFSKSEYPAKTILIRTSRKKTRAENYLQEHLVFVFQSIAFAYLELDDSMLDARLPY